MKHFSGTNYIKELEGIETLDKFCKNLKEDNDYIELFEYNVKNIETIIICKKSRNRIKENSN